MRLLEIRDLSLSINGTKILDRVNIEVGNGEIVGIVGESGSGKSLTAYSVMGLLPNGSSCEGTIEFGGDNLLSLDDKRLSDIRGNHIGMIFQEPMTALNPVHTIGQQVAETVLVHGNKSALEAREIAREALNRVGLPQDQFPMGRYPHELSGGQRQRVVIAMAIALRPKLLIADEPSTALDVTTQAKILELMQRLVQEDDMGLILITHDLAVVAGMAQTLTIMKDGRVLEQGNTHAVLRDGQHPYTLALLAASQHVPERLREAPGVDRSDAETVLRVEGIVRDYALPRLGVFGKRRSFRALDQINFDIARGERLGLVGESGCGKSTLTRAILALDPINAGSVYLLGEKFTAGNSVQRHLRRQIQVVFQDPYGSFNPRHRVERLVAEPFHLLDDPPRGEALRLAVRTALEQVGLHRDDAGKFIHEFSGGQRQRIAIARALIIKPALIILDEAVSALDVSIRAQILDLLADLSARLNLSYLFISHDLSVVRAVTERVIVMKAGQVVETGATDQVFAQPKHPYTQQLIAAAPNLGDILRVSA